MFDIEPCRMTGRERTHYAVFYEKSHQGILFKAFKCASAQSDYRKGYCRGLRNQPQLLLLSFSGCRVESAQANVKTNDTVTVKSLGTDNLINIGGYLYYDSTTKIVYFWNGSIGYGRASTTPSPYFAPNGLPYKYEPETNTFVEITE